MSKDPLEPCTVTTTATRGADEVVGAPTPPLARTPLRPELRPRERDRYAVVAEHGRGGLGRVIRAHDRDLGRDVAIKEILHRGEATEARFLREAMITARLEHPGIVPVHDAGRWPDGTPFYAMKLVSGRPLKELIREAVSARERLALLPHVTAVADAIAYAHDRGIIHRDLKPSNIIVGEFGETVVIDWGLAKDLESSSRDGGAPEPVETSSDSSVTRAGSILGTPAYMPPEQARGEEVDARADVYALGAVLYHVLAGVVPYGGSQDQIMARVLAAPPPPLEDVAPSVPADLAAIVGKAMARNARDRYADARTLAEDLRRFQTGQLVSAHSYSRAALLARWLRRHRVPVVVASVAFAALVVLGTVSVRRVVESGRQARAERAIAVTQRQEAEVARAQAVERANELILTQARSSLDRDPTATLAWLKAYPDDGKDAAQLHSLAADAASRGVSSQIFSGHSAIVSGAELSADGRTLMTVAPQDSFRLWDVGTGKVRLSVPVRMTFHGSFIMTKDRRRIAVLESESSVLVLDVAVGVPRRISGCTSPIWSIAFSSSGTSLACSGADNAVRVVQIESGIVREISGSGGDGPLFGLAFSADDKHVLTGHSDGSVRSWALTDHAGVRLMPGAAAAAPVFQILPSSDGRWLLVTHVDRTARLWRLGQPSPPTLEGTWHLAIASFSHDGRHIAIGQKNGTITVRDLRRGTEAVLATEGSPVASLGFSADGSLLSSGSMDGAIAVWDLRSDTVAWLRGHSSMVETVAFSTDGALLVSAGDDKTIRMWRLRRHGFQLLRSNATAVHNLVTSSAGDLVAWDGQDDRIRLRRRDSTLSIFAEERTILFRPRLSPDGGLLAAGALDGKVRVWATASGEPTVAPMDAGAMATIAFAPDGQSLAVGAENGSVFLWDMGHGSYERVLAHEGGVEDVLFAPSGDWLASAGRDHHVRVWKRGARTTKFLVGHSDVVKDIAVSPDGRLLASASWDTTVRVWAVDTGTSMLLEAHHGRVLTLDFERGGSLLASGDDTGDVMVWDLAAGEHRQLEGHTALVSRVAFSPNGRLLASASWDRTARIWDLDGNAVAVLRGHDSDVKSLAFLEEGRVLATGSDDGTVRLWELDGLDLVPADQLRFRQWLQAITSVPAPLEPTR